MHVQCEFKTPLLILGETKIYVFTLFSFWSAILFRHPWANNLPPDLQPCVRYWPKYLLQRVFPLSSQPVRTTHYVHTTLTLPHANLHAHACTNSNVACLVVKIETTPVTNLNCDWTLLMVICMYQKNHYVRIRNSIMYLQSFILVEWEKKVGVGLTSTGWFVQDELKSKTSSS